MQNTREISLISFSLQSYSAQWLILYTHSNSRDPIILSADMIHPDEIEISISRYPKNELPLTNAIGHPEYLERLIKDLFYEVSIYHNQKLPAKDKAKLKQIGLLDKYQAYASTRDKTRISIVGYTG